MTDPVRRLRLQRKTSALLGDNLERVPVEVDVAVEACGLHAVITESTPCLVEVNTASLSRGALRSNCNRPIQISCHKWPRSASGFTQVFCSRAAPNSMLAPLTNASEMAARALGE